MMNTEMIANAIQAYPGFAFTLGAAALWGARYVLKIKTENEQMKAETHRGERAAIMKIMDMSDILDELERDVLDMTQQVEADLIERQTSDLHQKDVLKRANQVMVDSITKKETFHNGLLDQFEELEGMLDGFDRVGAVSHLMGQMREAFTQLMEQQDHLHHDTLQLVDQLQTNLTTVQTLAREVGV